MTDSFFEGGGYAFLSGLESSYTDCASICDAPLFHLTKDVELGMPNQECLKVAKQDFIANGEFVMLLVSILAGCTLISPIFAFQ